MANGAPKIRLEIVGELNPETGKWDAKAEYNEKTFEASSDILGKAMNKAVKKAIDSVSGVALQSYLLKKDH